MKESFSFTIRYRKCIIGWQQQNLQVLVSDFIFKLVKSVVVVVVVVVVIFIYSWI